MMAIETWKEFWITLVLGLCAAALVFSIAYVMAYRHGQIDALEGDISFTSIKTEDGVYWYRTSAPGVLFGSRNESGDE